MPSGEERGFLGCVTSVAGKALSLLASFLVSEAHAAATSESTVTNGNGTFTFTKLVNASSTSPHYSRPSNNGGFSIYGFYNQDYGWKHTFPTFSVSGLMIQSVNLTIRSYDVDAEPANGYYGECDGITGDGSWLNPQSLQGTNDTWSVTTFNVDPSALMDGSLDVWIDINMHYHPPVYDWAMTLDYSQLQVVYSISSNSPPSATTLSVSPVDCTLNSDNLTVLVTGPNPPDPDGDSVTYEYRWLVDVGTGNYIDDEFAGRSNHTGNTVVANDTKDGDRWMVEVTPIDGHGARGNKGGVAYATIGQCNTPPIANAGGNQEANLNAEYKLDGRGSYDPDGSLTGYLWELYGGGTWQTIGENSFIYYKLTATGVFTVRLTVTDNSGATNSSLAYITIVVGNHPPIANAGPDQIIEQSGPSGAAVTLNGTSSSDTDGDQLTYNWTGPFGAASGMNPTVVLPAGVSTVSLTVSDDQATSSPDTVSLTVHDTTAPVIGEHRYVTAEATSAAGAAVDYISPVTTDAVDGEGTATCVPASGSNFVLGNTTVTCNATDKAGNAAWPTHLLIVAVKDSTAPVIDAQGNVTAEATSAAGAVVSYTSPATADAVDGAGAGAATCAPASGSIFALGTTTVTCNATDAAGNHAVATTFVVHVVDTTPPVFSNVPANFSVLSTSSSGAAANYTSPTATDLVNGVVGVSCAPPCGSTFAVGVTTVTCTAADARDNVASRSFTVAVVYNWTGFFQPVDNPGPTNIVNVTKAGSAVPLKFSLGGNMGLDIFVSGYPRVVSINVATGAEDLIEETVTAGSSSLTYNPGANQYVYVWKTEKAWVGKSYQLQVMLKDGSLHVANFKFK